MSELYDIALLKTLLGVVLYALGSGVLLAAAWSMVFKIKNGGHN